MTNVLIIGSGGREMAIAFALLRSPKIGKLFAYPGSDGLGEIATILNSKDEIFNVDVDLVIFGGETELVQGWSDEFRAKGTPVLGCSKAAAALEGSKDFLKDVLFAAKVPCAASQSFTDLEPAKAYLETRSIPIVLKTDGLAGGKGVVICETRESANIWLERYLSGEAFGDAGKCVIIEDFMSGPEISFFVLVDSEGGAHPLCASRDHKRIFDHDLGPNTGGMGAFTPVPEFTPALQAQVMDTIIKPSLEEMKARGVPFQGFLFAGLMLTAEGPKLLEYNIRLGDPETQVILSAIEGDFLAIAMSAAKGEMNAPYKIDTKRTRINVVLAAGGYPENPTKGAHITGLENLVLGQDYFHAGTKKADAGWAVNGGRVINVLGEGDDIEDARADAYSKVERIQFDGMQFRSDIGKVEA